MHIKVESCLEPYKNKLGIYLYEKKKSFLFIFDNTHEIMILFYHKIN